jgi:LuxR family transcriptional regulator, maltose regulon positive regulatory protein
MPQLAAVRDGLLHTAPDDTPVQVGTQSWFAWLREARSFTYSSTVGTFTAQHEERSGGRFWYAYRRRNGTLHKTYLGRSIELTSQHLEQAAQELANMGGKKPQSEQQGEWISPLITTKVAMPQLSASIISRPETLARCLESSERPCTVIAAPAGFGKTTLLTMTCEQLKERGWKIAWVSLEETEREPVRFWSYVLAALSRLQESIELIAQGMFQTPRFLSVERMLTGVVNVLMTVELPIALVLDDYHLAATPEIDQGLTFLIEHLPSTLRLFVSTRTEPGFLLPRLRAQGRIAELHATDLRFSVDEAERFMNETMHIPLSPDHMKKFVEQTEGWIAGLQLIGLALREHSVGLEFPAITSASTRYVAEYLIGEVLEHQPEDVQAFLLQTSFLDRLTGPLCDTVAKRTDSAAILTRLMQAQLFVTPIDPDLAWYRYHHLFAGILRERLQHENPNLVIECHQRAAQWFHQQNMMDEAIHHMLAIHAFEDIATLVEGEADRLVLRGDLVELVIWTSDLPREVILAHPHLCILSSIGLFLQGDGAKTASWLDDLEQSLAKTETYPSITKGELAVVRALLMLLAGDIAGGEMLAQEATQHLPENHLLCTIARWVTNITRLFGEEDLSELDRAVGEFTDENLQSGNIFVAFMACTIKTGIEEYQGRLHRAAQTCRYALRLVEGKELPITAFAYCMLGEIQRERNDLDGAENTLRYALKIGAHMHAEFTFDGFTSLAITQTERGNFDESLAIFEEIHNLIQTHQLAAWDIPQMDATRARILLMQGKIAEAIHWAETCQRNRKSQEPLSMMTILREAEDLVLARVMLAQGNAKDAIALLEELCTHATRSGRFRNVLEARMLLARARWMAGDPDAAMRDLDESLAIAAPEGFIRIFIDEGESMADLLDGYVASRPPSLKREHALKLLATYNRVAAPSIPPSTEILSPRELDVLRLLAAGHSNEAIASDLIVALSTVKWHIARIYRKLGVAGRVQAISRARELGIIP